MGTHGQQDIVAIARVRDDKIERAVEEAIDLLGGMEAVTEGKERIMLKPNLVCPSSRCTTKPAVVGALARMMMACGKEVLIGEGPAVAPGFNSENGELFRLRSVERLEQLGQYVFSRLGYTDLARTLGIPLIDLNVGEMVEVPVPGGLAFARITLHRALTEIDLLCSVPMMKTHVLATVTLGMKNLIGLYPGSVYATVRAGVHDHAAEAGSLGAAYEIIDMVRVNKLELVVVDGTTAMEGDGPTDGDLVPMGVFVAGTNPLATDMMAAHLMGFDVGEVPTFACAHQVGMRPMTIDAIEVRGTPAGEVRRPFAKPQTRSWASIREHWGVREIA